MREAGTAQDYGAVVPGLILGVKPQSMKFTPIGSRTEFVLELKRRLSNPATAQGYGSVMSDLILGIKKQTAKFAATDNSIFYYSLRFFLSLKIVLFATFNNVIND